MPKIFDDLVTLGKAIILLVWFVIVALLFLLRMVYLLVNLPFQILVSWTLSLWASTKKLLQLVLAILFLRS
jgi:hypothetical protein